MEQVRKQTHSDRDAVDVEPHKATDHELLLAETDDLLDEIDEILNPTCETCGRCPAKPECGVRRQIWVEPTALRPGAAT